MVSVIIPTYNREKVIKRSVESVLSQTYKDIEVIIVDDGSTDNTKEIISGIKDDRIKYMRSPKNRGQACARNVGMRRAKGDYIAFQDSDDVWLPDKLEWQMRCFDNDSNLGLVYCMFEYQNAPGGGKVAYPPKNVPMDIKTGYIFSNMFAGNLIGMPAAVIRKEVLNKVGYMDEQLTCLEDYEWLLRVTRNYSVDMIEDVLVHTYFSQDSVSKKKLEEAKVLCQLLVKYKDDIDKYDGLNDMLWRIRECGRLIGDEKSVESMLETAMKHYNAKPQEDIKVGIDNTDNNNTSDKDNDLRMLLDSVKALAAKQSGLEASMEEIINNQNKLQQVISQISINQYAMDCSIENIKYEVADQIINSGADRFVFPKFETIDETVEHLIQGKSMSRFGDGEFAIISGTTRHGFQKYDPLLSKRLKEVLQSKDDNVLIGIANMYGDLSMYTQEGRYNIRAYMSEEIRRQHYALLDMNRIYSDAYVSRPYSGYADNMTDAPKQRFERLKKIWDDKKLLIIEGEKTRMGVGNDLFDNAKDIIRILGPAENAFDRYSEIFKCACRQDKDRLVLIAMSATATVLAYDLAHEGFQAIDIGHIDLEYEWMKAGAGKKTEIKHKYNNELARGEIVEDIHDGKYEDQIIERII